MVNEATVKATGEKLLVYKLNSGNYYDYKSAGVDLKMFPPSAPIANKKEFTPDELVIGREVDKELIK